LRSRSDILDADVERSIAQSLEESVRYAGVPVIVDRGPLRRKELQSGSIGFGGAVGH
jgi:hypothetical protein